MGSLHPRSPRWIRGREGDKEGRDWERRKGKGREGRGGEERRKGREGKGRSGEERKRERERGEGKGKGRHPIKFREKLTPMQGTVNPTTGLFLGKSYSSSLFYFQFHLLFLLPMR